MFWPLILFHRWRKLVQIASWAATASEHERFSNRTMKCKQDNPARKDWDFRRPSRWLSPASSTRLNGCCQSSCTEFGKSPNRVSPPVDDPNMSLRMINTQSINTSLIPLLLHYGYYNSFSNQNDLFAVKFITEKWFRNKI